MERGALYIVSTPIGNLSDITQRAVDILRGVDLIAAEDTRKTGFLLDHLCVSKPLISYFSYNERRRVPELISRMESGSIGCRSHGCGHSGNLRSGLHRDPRGGGTGHQGHPDPRSERAPCGPRGERLTYG